MCSMFHCKSITTLSEREREREDDERKYVESKTFGVGKFVHICPTKFWVSLIFIHVFLRKFID